jgi:hypothetical protein
VVDIGDIRALNYYTIGRFCIMTLILTIPSIAIGNVSVSIHKTQHYDSKQRILKGEVSLYH